MKSNEEEIFISTPEYEEQIERDEHLIRIEKKIKLKEGIEEEKKI